MTDVGSVFDQLRHDALSAQRARAGDCEHCGHPLRVHEIVQRDLLLGHVRGEINHYAGYAECRSCSCVMSSREITTMWERAQSFQEERRHVSVGYNIPTAIEPERPKKKRKAKPKILGNIIIVDDPLSDEEKATLEQGLMTPTAAAELVEEPKPVEPSAPVRKLERGCEYHTTGAGTCRCLW